ncbi:MAG: pantoate--beta-alanine ligase [Proteobacteria bacterium]|nr:pantoate--beta-alanine ligase [Pseudomonadota bacterium]
MKESTVSEIKDLILSLKKNGKIISFVPTMGNLHQGHVSLVERARKESDIVVVSIFVNPTQFGPNEDFNNYPRTLDEDLKKIKEAGCDIVFTPEVLEMYPTENERLNNNKSELDKNISRTMVSAFQKNKVLCGKFRPGHFDGVLTIVLKLFNICMPDKTYFGLKDYQQYILIKDMVKMLNLDIEVIGCPIIRDKDGLALSSRNSYMSVEQRKKALSLSKALNSIKNAFKEGEKDNKKLKGLGLSIMSDDDINIQYVEIVDSETLIPVREAGEGNLVAIAGYCGNTRLIDNIIL